ncbi:MAG: hypothetical protein AAB582_01195 [Patescibacteria group bacterium]
MRKRTLKQIATLTGIIALIVVACYVVFPETCTPTPMEECPSFGMDADTSWYTASSSDTRQKP